MLDVDKLIDEFPWLEKSVNSKIFPNPCLADVYANKFTFSLWREINRSRLPDLVNSNKYDYDLITCIFNSVYEQSQLPNLSEVLSANNQKFSDVVNQMIRNAMSQYNAPSLAEFEFIYPQFNKPPFKKCFVFLLVLELDSTG